MPDTTSQNPFARIEASERISHLGATPEKYGFAAPAPDRKCCHYHRTGGFAYVPCKADPFEPELHTLDRERQP
jgi:hypothetical protein